jgi:putative membrane protein insertion efficiency factor
MSNSHEPVKSRADDGLPPERSASPRMFIRLLRRFGRLPADCLVFGVRVYQVVLSPFFGGQCRFTPSCSHYFIGAVRKHGAVKGSLKGVWRICRCHPWNAGGDDPP